MFLVLLDLLQLLPLLFLFVCFHIVADSGAQLHALLFNGLLVLRELLDLQVENQLHFSLLLLALVQSLLLLQLLLLVLFLDDLLYVCADGLLGRYLAQELLGYITDY